MKHFLLALGFLTRIPVPATDASADDFAAATRFYPLAGLVIGAIVAGAGWAGARIDPWTGALAALVAWAGVTGSLHLDGLSDLADGLGAAHVERTRLLSVMADPHIGSFGATALGLQILAKLVLLHALAPQGWAALMPIPFAARIGPLIWARWLSPITAGLGAQLSRAVRRRDGAGWLLLLAAASLRWPALLATPFLIGGFGLWVRARIGGINGDAHGAGIELVETGLLLAAAVIGTS